MASIPGALPALRDAFHTKKSHYVVTGTADADLGPAHNDRQSGY